MPAPDFSAMLRWPNVPACYGWLSLDRRGRWRLRGEALGHAGLNDFLNRQYAHDQDGNYFVQNGPQRVFVELEYTPWVLRLVATDRLETHTGEDVSTIRGAALDDEGNLLIEIPEGIALLCDRDLPALRDCLHLPNGESADDASLFEIIAQPLAGRTALTLDWVGQRVPVVSVRRSDVPGRYGFVASPQTVMTLQDTPDDEIHDRFPSPLTPPPRGGRGDSRVARDFHSNGDGGSNGCDKPWRDGLMIDVGE
ncbi:MAG: DUF2946 family protein [Candidatus Accumulibacter phosphatis]|uniref:DUF2946 family protein n=1 Tax=Candidatus Accumulibacter contiguus TaxID=2954381 RepID=A0ABX1TDR5_9PROT|nr:DUF2946 family protein [Candidatus Accumulibacter contiguus]NMQ06705.1 DUF2946 family protein [Candidatus Accumulibacter contiguus]